MEIYEDSFFDPEFADRELSSDFFDSDIRERIRSDPTLISFRRPFIFENEPTGVFGDYDIDNLSFNVGAKDVCEPLYKIDCDYQPAEEVYDWYRGFVNDPSRVFPNIEPANIKVPVNKYEKRIKNYPLEEIMSKELSMYNPTYTLSVDLAGICMCYSKEPKWEGVINVDKSEGPLFEPFGDTLKEFYAGDYVSMQFNPFHPFSITKVISMEWEGDICVGTYVDRGSPIPFRYDLQDDRYRIHSDQWKPLFEGLYHYSLFDLVSNYDFSHLLSFTNMKLTLEPLFIEPYVTNRVPTNSHYSHIGPWEGWLHRGLSTTYYVPGFTQPMEYKPESYHTSFYNLSHLTVYDEVLDTLVIDLSSLMNNNTQKSKINISPHPHEVPVHFFVKMVKKNRGYYGTFNVLVSKEWIQSNDYDSTSLYEEMFLVCNQLFFSSCPKNAYGSLYYGPKITYATEIVGHPCKMIHEFVSMSVPDLRPVLKSRKITLPPDKILSWKLSNDVF